MGASGRGIKRKGRATKVVSLRGMKRKCRSFFLDSGAHSLYNLHVLGKAKHLRYVWYASESGRLTKDFRKYLDDYARFVLKYESGIDYYANVDAIYNPEISWQALKYLEDKGLKPVPVIHHKTSLKWVEKHLKAGYKYIGLGGLGQESTKGNYYKWADQVFNLLCDNRDRLPVARTHGFAMTSYDLLIRYPWWSVDSSSAFKAAGFSTVYVPHKRNGEFTFGTQPYIVGFSTRPNPKKADQKHHSYLTKGERLIVHEWLDTLGLTWGKLGPDGEMAEYGVVSSYNARAVANLKFFERLCSWLPKWPWPFKVRRSSGFLSYEEIGL